MSQLFDWMEGGSLLTDLTAELEEVAARVRETGKPGTLTCTIKVARKGSYQIEVESKIDAKPPKFDRESTVLYVDDDGRVSRYDPRQPAIPLMKEMDDR